VHDRAMTEEIGREIEDLARWLNMDLALTAKTV
jgi:hypothetical protein